MTPLLAAAMEVQGLCNAQGWRYCIIGGLAVQRWGEPRLTTDVDVTLLTGFGTEREFASELLRHLDARVPDAATFAVRARVLLARASNGVSVDLALGGFPFEERAVERATDFTVTDDVTLRTCSAEDLVVFKAFAGREQDWVDLQGILVKQGDALDLDLVWDELLPLLELKEAPEDAQRLRDLVERCR